MLNVKLGKVIAYTYQNQWFVGNAAKEFFGNNMTKINPSIDFFENINCLFNEWMIFDYKERSGSTPIVEYTLINPDNLPKNQIGELLEIIKTQKFEFFEIESIKHGEWIKVYGLYSGNKYQVYDIKGSQTLSNKGSFWARVAFVNKKWQFVGSDSLYYPVTSSNRIRKFYLKSKTVFSPKNALDLILSKSNKKQVFPKDINIVSLTKKRKELEEEYRNIQIKYNIRTTFKKVVDYIYFENYTTNFADFFADLIKLGIKSIVVYKNTRLFNDLWNHFPHKVLKDKSPVEIAPDYYMKS